MASIAPNFIWDDSANDYGVTNYPKAATFFNNEASATQETPLSSNAGIPYSAPGILTGTTFGNMVNSFLGIDPQDSSGLSTNNAQYQSTFGNSSTGTGSISSFISWIENGIGSSAVRGGVVILGFILVAVGLSMFKNGSLQIKVAK